MSNHTKCRIEAAYEREEQSVEAGVDTAGQMTVAFCGGHLTGGPPKAY